jgi:putative transcriptional regulator
MFEESTFFEISKGMFLIASPEIDSGIFFRSVILLCEHTPSGSFGLMINKKLDLDLPEEILNVEDIQNPNIGIRAGGPVQANQMMLLHSSDTIPEQTLEICPSVHLGGDLQFLQETIRKKEGAKIHLCFGYTGWGEGQLEREFLEEHWFTYQAKSHYIFNLPSDKIWSTLLKDMGGKFAPLSMIPEDLSLN